MTLPLNTINQGKAPHIPDIADLVHQAALGVSWLLVSERTICSMVKLTIVMGFVGD